MSKVGVKKLKIKYIVGDKELLNDVEPLWHGLIEHMLKSSTNFKTYYSSITFEKRKNALLKKTANGEMHIAIALEQASGQKVGYCISSVSEEKTGEIDSLFVAQDYRGFGVGACLMKNALAWMDTEGAENKIVEVGQGNEKAFGFYSRFGFQPRKTVMKQV